VRKTF